MSLDIYLEMVGNVDIALDTIPYNGATTTFDTLWMGVPLIGIRGDRGISRGTYSILRAFGLDELIAKGHAYQGQQGVLFHVPSMKDYGKLSRQPRDEIVAGARQRISGVKPADRCVRCKRTHDRIVRRAQVECDVGDRPDERAALTRFSLVF